VARGSSRYPGSSPPGVVKSGTSQFRILCMHWPIPLVPSSLRLSSSSTRPNLRLFTVSVTLYWNDKPFQLVKATLFLPLTRAAPIAITQPDQMGGLYINWAPTVEGIRHTCGIQKKTLVVLSGIVSSPHWCPHIVMKKWKPFHFSSGDSVVSPRSFCSKYITMNVDLTSMGADHIICLLCSISLCVALFEQ